MDERDGADVTIRPPFEARANAVMARSISAASRTSIGLTSTPERRRHGLDYGELADPGGIGGIAQDGRSRHARRDLLEQLQPFAANAVLEQGKSGDVAARPRQAFDEAGADRIDDLTNTIGTVRVACSNAASDGGRPTPR